MFLAFAVLLSWPRLVIGAAPAQAPSSAAVLMYANPAVVADPASAGQLLEALLAERRMPTPVPPSSSSATLDTFRSLQLQPPDLASFPRAHGSAAYIIPYQGLVRTYAEVELGVDGGSGGGGGGSGRDPSAPPPAPTGAAPTPSALKSLREFVSAGGNLVLLGNTGEQAALGLIQRVLDRPPGCRPAAVRFRARAGGAAAAAEDASAAALPPVLAAVRTPDVFLPLGGTGPECGGAVGMLECMPATGPAAAAAGAAAAPAAAGPVPWFDRVGTGRGGAAAGLDEAMVGPGFVWPHGRGRVIWLGATFDSATSVDWVRLLAAAALAPPLPAGYWDTPPPARPPPPPLGPPPPPPQSWRQATNALQHTPPPTPPSPMPVTKPVALPPPSSLLPSPSPPSPQPLPSPASTPPTPRPNLAPPPQPMPSYSPPTPRPSPSPMPPPQPPPPFPPQPAPSATAPPRGSLPPRPPSPVPQPLVSPPTPARLPVSAPPAPLTRPSPQPSPQPSSPPPRPLQPPQQSQPTDLPLPPRAVPPPSLSPSPAVSASLPPRPVITSPQPQSPPPTPARGPAAGGGDEDAALLPPGSLVEEEPPSPPEGPSVPPYPPEDPGFPEPPEAPVFPPAMPSPPPSPPFRPCQDYPADGYYNCTAWMEVPDVDFCDPDFYVDPPPSGSSNSSGGPGGEAAPLLSVLRDVCPRSCGQCCADLYYECGAWWEQGYCSWLYTISDPDDPGLVQDVPRACQASCQTCDGSGSSNTGSSGSAPPPPVPSPAAALAPGTNGVVSPRRRALLGRDKQNVNKGSKSAAGNAPVSRAKPLAKPQDWKDGDLAPNADKSQAKRKDSPLKQLSDMLSDSNTRDKLLDAAYNSGVGQRLVPGTGIRGDPHIDLQKPFAVNSAGDGKKVTMKDGREVRFAAVDFQTQSTNKLSDSFARAYVPLGYSVHQDVISAALMRSARTQRTVTILPPPARGDNGALRSFTQFSQVDPEDTNVRWTLVEGKVASDPPTGWDTKAQAVNNVLFGGGEGGTIALAAQQEADVGVATYDRGAFTSKAGNDDNWGIDSSCGRKGARLLLQGCSSGGGGGSSGGGSSSSGGDGGWAGDDDNGDGKKKVCKVTYVRLKDGRRVRRRVCKTVRSQG